MPSPFQERRYLIPFRAILLPQIDTDVLVIGSGVAGLSAALSAASGAEVIVLAKGPFERSNTWYAQGGIAAVLAEEDSTEAHVEDTLEAGAGLCERGVVERIVRAGPERVRWLLELGMRVDRDASGALVFGREGAHSRPRILHADGDATGRAVAETLLQRAHDHERVRLFDRCFALDLVTDPEDENRVVGAITWHPRYGLQVIRAWATILAAGGSGQIYRETTNSPGATGDGLAMAWRAGAELADMEFVQFHPTTLYLAGAHRALISEAVRGEGALLVDRAGRRFMVEEHPMAELAPRDIVSRAILRRIASTGESSVFLDARPLGEHFKVRFPGISALLAGFDIDPATDLIPIRPAAHYTIGGVAVDEAGRSSVPGLFACGEAASTGLHGANRLASNSLLEGLVCGYEAGSAAIEHARPPRGPLRVVSDIRPSERSELDVQDVLSSLRSVMWRHVGIEREGARLAEVAEMVEFWARYTMDKIFDGTEGWELQNALTIGAALVRAALWRRESRGTHFRVDAPEPSDAFRVRAAFARGAGEPRELPLD